MKVSIFYLIISMFFLTGCLKYEAPKCSNPDVELLVKQLYKDSLNKLTNNPMTAIFITAMPKEIKKLTYIRPTSYNKEISLRECKAEAVFDKNISAAIHYNVQLTEDQSDKYIVELDTTFMEGLMQKSLLNGLLK